MKLKDGHASQDGDFLLFSFKNPEKDLFSHFSQKPDCSTPSPARPCQGRWYHLTFCSHFHFHQQLCKCFWAPGHNLLHGTCQENPPGDSPTLCACSLVCAGLCLRRGMSLSGCASWFFLGSIQPPQLLI